MIKNPPVTEEMARVENHSVSIGHILLVGDEGPIVRMEQQMLERMGCHITSCTCSLKALETFKKNPVRFGLVITDMTMPHMTGDQLVRELMAILSDLPVILSVRDSVSGLIERGPVDWE